MNGNRIITVFTNYGVLAQPSLDKYPRLAWKYPANGYIGDCSPVIGVELPVKDYNGDSIPDTIHSVKVTAVSRPGGGKASVGGKSWTFEPLPGYFNPAIVEDGKGVAISTQPETWPASWADHPEWGPGVWNGLRGANNFTGVQEAFYKMDDQNDEQMYDTYGFRSDSADTTKKGCGLEVSTRFIQFQGEDFQDVLFRVYDLKNTSTTNYQKVVFGNLTGTYIGISGDEWNDDVALFYPKDNIIIASDFDNYIRPTANPRWRTNPNSVGRFGEKFLASPQNNKITSFQCFVPASDIKLADNEDMWKRLRPGFYSNPISVVMGADSVPVATRGEDGDYMYGSGYFPLNAKETKRIITAIGFGNTDAEVLMRLKKAEVLANIDFHMEKLNSAITIQGFNGKTPISGTTNITWLAEAQCTSVEIWYSPDLGITWTAVTREAPNTGNYTWNTSEVNNSIIGSLRIFAKKNGALFGFSDSPHFSLQNGAANVLFMQVVSPDYDFSGTVSSDELACELYMASLNALPLHLKVFYSIDGTTDSAGDDQPVTSSLDIQKVNINIGHLPNSKTFSMKFLLTNGVDSLYDFTPVFTKENIHSPLTSELQFVNTAPAATVEARVINKSALLDHQYRVTFVDTALSGGKRLSVYDVTSGAYRIQDYHYTNEVETPAFDGMTLFIKDFETGIDSSRSGWNISRPGNLSMTMSRFINSAKYIVGLTPPKDYMLVFNNTGTNSSNAFPTIFGSAVSAVAGINFAAYEIPKTGSPAPVQFAYIDRSDSLKKFLSNLDKIILSNNSGTEISYSILFSGTNEYVPTMGDTLRIYTKRGLTIFDTLIIDGPNVIKNNNPIAVTNYQLYQNYPNPFNPTTTITYALPEKSQVDLTIYNQLGQRVAVLFSGEKNAGTFSAAWNAANYSSGIYFYQLKTDKFISVKKLILLK